MSPASADGVNFVNEDEARHVFACLFKHVANATGADADEHFDKVRTTDAEEGGVSLARDRLGQKRLARSGSADHENAFGNAAAETLKLFRVLQKLDQFGNLLFGFLDPGNVLEGDLVAILA